MLKLIKNEISKKIMVMILLMLIIFSTAQPIFAVSSSGTGRWTPGQYDSGVYTTENKTILIRKLTNTGTGESITVFCAEHGAESITGSVETATHIKPSDPTLKEACKVAFFGWYSKYGNYVVDGGILDDSWAHDRRMDYVFTQQMIWETLGDTSATFRDSDIQSQYQNFKNNINEKIKRIKTKPSFSDTTITVEVGESKVLTDNNGVLSDYCSIDTTNNEVRFTHNKGENTLTINVGKNCTQTEMRITNTMMQSWGLVKEETIDKDTTVYFQFRDGVQNQLYAMNYNDPVTMSLNLKIQSKGKLELKKLDENGSLIDGAVFNVTGPNEYNQDVTVTNGKIVLENLDKGTYTVKEKNAPSGYLLDTKSYMVEVKAGQTATQSITDGKPTGEFLLTKYNKDKSEKLVGVKYRIWNDEGYNKEISTDGNGQIRITGLKLGKYHYQETESIFGYLVDNTVYSFELTYKDQNTKVVSVSVEKTNEEPTGELTLTKYNEDKSAKLEGVKYKIWNDEGYDKEIATDNNGQIHVTNLKLGTYHYKEIQTIFGYLIDDKTYTFTLSYEDQNTEVVYSTEEKTNKEPTGEISITKTDIKTGNSDRVDGRSHHGDATLNGAVYTLYAKNDIYNVAKTKKYFSKDEAIATYTFNDYGVATVEIINSETSAKISAKSDTICGLPLGNYYSKETTVPTGYNKDTNIYDYVLAYKDEHTEVIKTRGTVVNEVQKAPFEVIKVSTNSNTTAEIVPNAEFTAILSKYVNYYGSFDEAKRHLEEYADDEYSIFNTGSNGHGVSGLLAYGEYTVNETYTPSPEITTVEEFYVTIDKDSNTPIKELVENDLPFEAYIKMQKKDKESGKYVTYSNATFSLYKLNEDSGIWEMQQCKIGNNYYHEWTTNEDGIVRTETKMPAGKYKVEEIKIPDGYLQLDEELTFDVNNRNKTLEYDTDWDAWITVTAVNEQPKGRLEVNKTINLRSDADKTLITDIDYTKIAFELVANEKIIDYMDGSTVYEEGQKVGTYNLDSEGKLVVDNLWMGSYYLKEVSTIDGAVIDDTKYDVKFTQIDTSTKKYTVKLDIGNDTTFIEISKRDITGEDELQGAKLSVLDKEGNVIDSWTSSEKTHKIEGLKVGNTYVLREEIAPDGFVKSTDIEFKVENTAKIQKVQMIDKIVEMYKKNFAGEELEGAKIQVFDTDNNLIDEWTSEKTAHRINGLEEEKTYRLHEEIATDGYVKATDVEFTVSTDKDTQKIVLIDKIVEMSKVDIGGNEIEGAEITVTDESGEIVDSWTSTKEAHNITGLEEGKTYTLHEETAPAGFVKATDVEFTVSTDKDTQKIVLIDKIVEMSKVDIGGNEIEGAEITVTDESGEIVDSWTSTKEAHNITGLEEGKTYTLHEETAPAGFVKATDVEFTVTTDKDTQELVLIDKIVDVTKTDLTTGKELEGAELVVTDEEGNVVDSWTSTKEPHHITGLKEGEKYTLTEKTAPYGYEITESIEFEVGIDKNTQKIEMKDMPILQSVKLIKKDSKNEEIIKDKFVFGIFEDEECTKLIKEVESDKEQGIVLFENLRYGVFFIKELSAPKGYILSDKIVKVEMNDKGVFIDGEKVEGEDSVYTFEFYNTPIDTPKTGDNSNMIGLIALLVMSALAITGIGVHEYRKRKYSK